MAFTCTVGASRHVFADLRTLLAKASPARSGDALAGIAAASEEERMAARMALADVPLTHFLSEALIPYEDDEVTRLIVDGHDAQAFSAIAALTVGDFRNWLLRHETDEAVLARVAPGITPEMAAAVSKLMRNQDLVAVARKCRVVTRFRGTIGLAGRLAVRLQPNHPTDDPRGIAASIIDGLLYGCGDATIGVNPASDNLGAIVTLLKLIDDVRARYDVPTQSCVLTHVTNTLRAIELGAPVDLVFQSVAGSQRANEAFGISLALLGEARQAALALNRGTVGHNVMYFETGQGSALSANAHHGVDQQTMEARAYGVARVFEPLLVNTVVGFIGPEYLYDGKQIIRAGLEDHFCGKLLGVPMGCDVCYTNHAEADQDDMDTLLTLFGVAGINFIMGVPGADDIMLNYQSTSFHDALYLREVLGVRPAPEFEAWLQRMGILDPSGRLLEPAARQPLLDMARSLDTGTPNMPKPPASPRVPPASPSPDPWAQLRQYTRARIALGRAGHAQKTESVLAFGLAHAQARDAVHLPLDAGALEADLRDDDLTVLHVHSAAPDRDHYLRRPDLGRQLDADSRSRLDEARSAAAGHRPDVVFVIADGLSALAAQRHGVPLLRAVLARLHAWQVGPVVIARQSRVALGDDIGERLGARQVVMLIGERPGLSSPDSLGIYLTYDPHPGRTDAQRNCISNVRPEGLPYAQAADRLVFLLRGAVALGRSGVDLKDDSEDVAPALPRE